MKLRSAQRGFTIVELLVVISIIAMLSAILLPAVNSARSAARQMACIQNQGQLGKAMAQYAATKDRLPSYVSQVDPGVPVGWAYRILPQIDKQSVRDALSRAGGGLLGTDLTDAYLAVLVCPDDAFTMDPTLGPMSYAVNGGLLDNESANPQPTPPDWRDNGSLSRSYPSFGSSLPPQSTTIDYISSHDGVSTTLMLAENVSFGARRMVDGSTAEFERASWLPNGGQVNNVGQLKDYEISQVVLWSIDVENGDPSAPVFQGFQSTGGRNIDGWDDSSHVNHSAFVPSSSHSGGFVATYCDGHTQFVGELMDYQVYARLMTSNGIQSRPAGVLVTDLVDVDSDNQPDPQPPYQKRPVSELEMNP